MARRNLPRKDEFKGEIIEGYFLEEERGRGNVGVVYRAHHKDIEEMKVAIKIIPEENLKNNWEIELRKVGVLDQVPQVIQPRDPPIARDLHDVSYVCSFWEYIDGDNLREYVKNNPDNINIPFIEHLIDQILVLFMAMKRRRVDHGDLHGGNILLFYNELLPEPDSLRPTIKVGDFGIGGSHNDLKPKDDYIELARICHDLLEHIDPSKLDGEDRYVYDELVYEFLPKKIWESDPTVGDFVREPQELRKHHKDIRASYRDDQPQATVTLKSAFDYLSCEEMGDSFELLQTLYSKNFPGYEVLSQKTNTILTGPRGCGKTTIFRNLSLKAQLLGGKKHAVEDLDGYIGIYYHCTDLYFAFPYLRDKLSRKKRNAITHFFNLAILYEILGTLAVAQKHLSGVNVSDLDRLQGHMERYLPSYKSPPLGAEVLQHMLSFVTGKKDEIKTWMERGRSAPQPKAFLPLDFIGKTCTILQQTVPWLSDRPMYFFLDDYSLPRISKQIQETLHDFIFQRYSECFFKISTESITSFYPYDSKRKLIEESREYDVVDLGTSFLHSRKTKAVFLAEVVNNRLTNTEGIYTDYQDIEAILGRSRRSYNKLATEIREPGKRVYYHGWDMVVDLCSGDVAHTLRLVRDIFFQSGGLAELSEPNGISIPIKEEHQDRAIRKIGNDFLNRVEAAPDIGEDLRKIAVAFGELANWYLRHENSKNLDQNPPRQTFRIEVQETPYFDETFLGQVKRRCKLDDKVRAKHLEKLYTGLVRYGVFLRDAGKSQRGAVVPRLYLRRLLIPTFLLTPNQRDNIRLEVGEFFMLLSDPDRFVDHMKKKKEDGQGRFPFDE